MLKRLQRYSGWAAWMGLGGGALFLAWLVAKIGPDTLARTLGASPWQVLGILLVYGFFQVGYCIGWSWTLQPLKVGCARLFGIYLAGDTLSYLIPLAGEPLKARLLQPEYPMTEGLYSVSVAKFCEFVAQLIFYIVGLTMALFAFKLEPGARLAGLLLIAGLGAGLGVLFYLQRKGLYGPAIRLWERITGSKISPERRAKIEDLDRRISAFYSGSPKAFLLCLLFKFIGKLGGAAEAALVLLFLGHRPTIAAACAIETLAMIANDALFFIPGRVGGAEGGRVLVFLTLGFTAAEGLNYAVIRRLRELLWVGFGLLYLFIDRSQAGQEVEAVLTEAE